MRARRAVAATMVVLATGCSAGVRDAPELQRDAGSIRSPEPTQPEARPGRPDDPLAAALAGEPQPPSTAREAAAQLVAAAHAIRDPSTAPRLLAAAGHTQQLAVRAVAEHPGWDRRIGKLLPPGLRRATADSVAADRAFRSMHPSHPRDLADELPTWRIVAPPPAARLRGWYREAERRFGVDWEYLAAINLVETRFGRIRGTSVAGAQGPMQFIPTTWEIYGAGGDIRDPHDAILAAGRLLRANGFASDPAAALHRYNNSGAYVRGVTLYARVMQRRPWSYRGFHQWQVYYLTRAGSVWLPEGYAEREPVPVRRFLARDPVH